MDKLTLETMIKDIYRECPGNVISEETAISPKLKGLNMFDEPLIGFGSAEDPLYESYKKVDVIGPWHKNPKEWIAGAQTVVSIFFPFTREVRESNRKKDSEPSPEWLHGRIEGQEFIAAFDEMLRDKLCSRGVEACVPAIDPRFMAFKGVPAPEEYSEVEGVIFGSNWSERHTAFVCGLGTFGLSKGIITKKGMAGRFASVIIDEKIEADVRPYTDIYEYCIQCGACIPRCPVAAISFEKGKNHMLCKDKLLESGVTYAPRYGCGKCQTAVPCEDRIPLQRNHTNIKNNI